MDKSYVFNKDAELKFSANEEANPKSIGTLEGYAMTWDQLSEDRGGFFVKLAPMSAQLSDPTLALWSHDRASPLGTTENGTLRYSLDEKGVKVSIDLPNTTLGRDTKELVSIGTVKGMSFEMSNPKFEKQIEGKNKILYAKSFNVREVTVTSDPAFAGTSLNVKYEDVITDADKAIADAIENQTKEFSRKLAKLKQYKLNALNL